MPITLPAKVAGEVTFLKDTRLSDNGNITRMPTTQRQWNTFIQELDKWVKSESGNFEVGGTADAQFTGFSTDPTWATALAQVWWQRYGPIIHMRFYFDKGVSNSTAFAITGIPEALRPNNELSDSSLVGGLEDNSTAITTAGSVLITDTGVIHFYPQADLTGNWTASGNKGFFSYSGKPRSIFYTLWDPTSL